MPQHRARQRLDLDILERGALHLGEVADLRLGEADVLEIPGAHLRQALPDLGLAEAIVLAVPVVEPDRHLARGGIAAPQPASSTADRNWRVRSFCGAVKIRSGGPCSAILPA